MLQIKLPATSCEITLKVSATEYFGRWLLYLQYLFTINDIEILPFDYVHYGYYIVHSVIMVTDNGNK